MKPLDMPAKKNVRADSKVKMLIRVKLGWLYGYPVIAPSGNLRWYCLDPLDASTGFIDLKGSDLSHATRAIQTLLRDFPNALPRVVGDVTSWKKHYLDTIEHLKPLVHCNHPIIDTLFFGRDFYLQFHRDLVKTLIEHHPQLEDLLQALSWVFVTSPKNAKPVLKFVSQHPEYYLELLSIDFHLAVKMCLFSVEHKKSISGMQSLISKNTMDLMPVHQIVSWARQCAKKIANGERVDVMPRLSLNKNTPLPKTIILRFFDWLFVQGAQQQRRVLKLLNILDLHQSLSPYKTWWNQLENVLQFGVAQSKDPKFQKDKQQREAFRQKVIKLTTKLPSDFSLKCFLDEIQTISDRAQLTDLLLKLLKKLKPLIEWQNRTLLSIRYMTHFIEDHDLFGTRFLKYCDFLCVYLEDAKPSYLRPFIHSIGECNYWVSCSRLFDVIKTNAKLELAFDALCRVMEGEPEGISPHSFIGLAHLISHGFDLERVLTLFSLFCADGIFDHYKFDDSLALAAYFDAGNNDVLYTLIVAFNAIEDEDQFGRLELLVNAFRCAGEQELFKRLLVNNHINNSLLYGYKVLLFQKVREPVPAFPQIFSQSADWIAEYPFEFHSVLEQLAGQNKQAERIAAKVLSQYCRAKSSAHIELQALKSMVSGKSAQDQIKLQKRINGLEQRIHNSKPLSKAKTQSLVEKLNDMLDLKRFEAWKEQVDKRFSRLWGAFFGLSQTPEWLLQKKYLQLLLPVLQLDKNQQPLAQRILYERIEHDRFNLNADLANQEFIKKMSEQGVQMNPWIDGLGMMQYPTQLENVGIVSLAFEEDPLELLNMGGYFETCLSPGDFNFFSVFANIADVNKRVLYARDAQHKIVGRVLLALSDAGGILVYYRYATQKAMGFDAMVTNFVEGLAQVMQTLVVDSGHVSTLVAKEWYDDGSINVGVDFDVLKAGSELREALATMSAADILPAFETALSPLALNALTLPLIVGLPEFEQRPQIALVLAHKATQVGEMPLEAYINILKLALAAELGATCFSLLEKQVFSCFRRTLRTEYWIDPANIKVVVHCNPAKGLQLLKATRYSWVKCWEEEGVARRQCAIQALELLGRTQQAERLASLSAKSSDVLSK